MIMRIAVAFLAGLVVAVGHANACSCVRGDDRVVAKFLRQVLRQPGAALVEVEATASDGGQSEHTTTFKVIQSWVGATGAEIKVHHATSSAACGVTFTMGERYVVLASSGDQGLRTNACTQLMASRVKAWGKARVQELLK